MWENIFYIISVIALILTIVGKWYTRCSLRRDRKISWDDIPRLIEQLRIDPQLEKLLKKK